jgi:hypothetical protein
MVGQYLSEQRSLWIATAVGLGLVLLLSEAARAQIPYLGAASAATVVEIGMITFYLALVGGAFSGPITVAARPSPVQSSPSSALSSPSSIPTPSAEPSASPPASTNIGGSFDRLETGLLNPQGDPTLAWRLEGWREALHHIGRSPVLGDRFGTQFSWNYGTRHVENYPHNTYLTLALKSGIPGALLFCLPLAFVVRRTLLAIRTEPRAPWDPILVASVGGIAALTIYGSLNLLLESPFLAWPLWGLIGLALARADRRLASPTADRSDRRGMFAMLTNLAGSAKSYKRAT